jgi:hypothetical protein
VSDFDPAEITREKSLWDVYKLCRKLPRRRSRAALELSSVALLVAYVLLSNESSSALAERVRSWATVGFGFSVAILGFLLAGFTIFATMTRTDLAVEMAKQKEDETGLSYLKYNFAAFLDVFIKYLAFVGIYLAIVLFGPPGGLASILLNYLPSGGEIEKRILAAAGVVAVGYFLVHMLVALWAFVFNVYHVVMTAIRWEAESSR